MKKLFALVPIIALIGMATIMSTGCIAAVRGVGGMVEKEQEITGSFTSIRISNALNVTFRHGDEHTVTATMQENLFELLVIDISANTLNVIMSQNFRVSIGYTPRIVITAPQLSSISLANATTGYVQSAITGDAFRVYLSGASTISVPNLGVNTLYVNASGASSATLGGNIAVFANVFASGASTIALGGNATTAWLSASGASDIRALNLQARYSSVAASGASHVRIAVSETLSVTATGASSVRYRGNPTIISQTLYGASTLRRVD
ncbi:MAG: DUF2807 domain-containing protein [Firmicutes bacterium]|nr:DUF2807 domain-containing protein [Bacillota bacterium]